MWEYGQVVKKLVFIREKNMVNPLTFCCLFGHVLVVFNREKKVKGVTTP